MLVLFEINDITIIPLPRSRLETKSNTAKKSAEGDNGFTNNVAMEMGETDKDEYVSIDDAQASVESTYQDLNVSEMERHDYQ